MSKRPEAPRGEGEPREPDEPFLRRWARRKGRAAATRDDGPGTDAPTDPPGEDALEPTATAHGLCDRGEPGATGVGAEVGETVDEKAEEKAEEKGDEDMPPLESIDEGGSVADFFSGRVSPELRRAALRRLFAQHDLPVVDDLDDYAADYTKYRKLGDLVTNEMRHRLEVAAQRLARRAEERLAAADPAPAAGSDEAVTIRRDDANPSSRGPEETDDDGEDSAHERSSD